MKYGVLVAVMAWCGVVVAQTNTTFFLTAQDINRSGSNNATLIISSPGTYILTEDVFFTKVNVTAITVQSDDVIIDFDGHTLRAANPSGENIGINVTGPSRRNFTLRNGTLANFNVFGVMIAPGSRNVTFEDFEVVCANVQGRIPLAPMGINLDGVPLSSVRTADVVIKNCNINNARFGLRAQATDGVRITNSTFNSNGSRGITGLDCSLWELTNCQASNQQTTDELGNFGLVLQGGFSWHITNSDFSLNRISTNPGFVFPTVGGAQFQPLFSPDLATRLQECGAHVIENCTFCDNTTLVSGVRGVGLALVFTGSCVVRNCIACGNFSLDVLEAGFLDAGVGNLYSGCLAVGNFAAAATMFGTFGFNATGSLGACFINCIAQLNVDPGAFGGGFSVDGTSSRCLVQNCKALTNSPLGFVNASPTSVFTGNFAFGNLINYLSAGGPLGFITVINGTQPSTAAFDEREIDNISVV